MNKTLQGRFQRGANRANRNLSNRYQRNPRALALNELAVLNTAKKMTSMPKAALNPLSTLQGREKNPLLKATERNSTSLFFRLQAEYDFF
ncbi:MAG: hypothetical protein II150_07875 [Thermoguttaceae bacterium]|nr:hypothetical protein [Thermoguttaceae bacterium]